MTRRFYADFKTCEHCGNHPTSLFLISVSGYRRFNWSNKTAQSVNWLKSFLRGNYVLAGVVKFSDNYTDEVKPEEILKIIETAETVIELDFIPC